MHANEKQVDGPDLERAEHKETLREQAEQELPELAGEEVRDVAQSHDTARKLIDAVRMILGRQQLSVSSLRVPQREARALEALQAAVSGRSTSLGQFVFAEDRRSMLEQALAVLQPNLAGGETTLVAEMQETLTQRVVQLRHELKNLADAQDDLMEEKERIVAAMAGDGADKPKPKPEPSAPDAARPASTLARPGRPEPTKPPTTLVGPDVKPQPKPPTTLDGPEVTIEPKPASTLTGAEIAEPPEPPSTLAGPEITQVPEPPSTLGDPEEVAKIAKKPWWKRPFG